MVYKTMLKRNW